MRLGKYNFLFLYFVFFLTKSLLAFAEDKISEFSGPEIVMACTKFLSCALTNDSGTSHMLSTNYCPIIKLFGPKDSDKFTPKNFNITNISAKEFGSTNMSAISTDYVIKKIEDVINTSTK